MCVVEAESAVVLVGYLGEHVRPEILGLLPLVAGPGRRTEVSRGGVAGDGLLQFQADYQCGPVVAGPQVGHRGQGRHAA